MNLLQATHIFHKYAVDLTSLEITPENLEEVLGKIFKEIRSIDEKEKDILAEMKRLRHRGNEFHYDESIFEHTKEVLQNIIAMENEIKGLGDEAFQLMKLVAIFHDIGKVHTITSKKVSPGSINGLVGGYTFPKHAQKSAEILKKLIEQRVENKTKFHDDLIELVEHHDDTINMMAARKKNDPTYVKSLVDGPIGTKKLLEHLKIFLKADSVTTAAIKQTAETLDMIAIDIPEYHEHKKRVEERPGVLRQMALDKKDEIIAFLQDKAPELIPLFPDMSAIRKALGSKKDINVREVMQQLAAIVPPK